MVTVHPDDEMMQWSRLQCATPVVGEMAHFRVGLVIADVVRQLASTWVGALAEPLRLDFACGCGRSPRFTAQDLGAGSVTGAEILPDAVAFVQDAFGRGALQSSAEPSAFEAPQRDDLVFASSLFGHLPDQLFHQWLTRLSECLTDDGPLVFSTHDPPLLPTGAEVDRRGYHCQATTEVDAIDTATYGATVVSEQYVRSAVEAAFGHESSARTPRGLCFDQDLFLVPRVPSPTIGDLAVRRGPQVQGAIDQVRLDGTTIVICGWAGAKDPDDVVVGVERRLGGEFLARVAPSGGRPDEAAALHTAHRPDRRRSGWRAVVPVDGGPVMASSVLTAIAITDAGARGAF